MSAFDGLSAGFADIADGFHAMAGNGQREEPDPRPRWFLATCQDCTPVLPQPFDEEWQRTDWVAMHRDFTGHKVTLTEVAARAEGDR